VSAVTAMNRVPPLLDMGAIRILAKLIQSSVSQTSYPTYARGRWTGVDVAREGSVSPHVRRQKIGLMTHAVLR